MIARSSGSACVVFLQRSLTGLSVAEAENGSDGIDKAQTLHPDLIVIDLVMPVLNGIEATRLLKRLCQQPRL